MNIRLRYIVVAAAMTALVASGCSKPDPTTEAAPPPGPNARPETMGGMKKNMPSNSPTNMGGGTAAQGGPAQKP